MKQRIFEDLDLADRRAQIQAESVKSEIMEYSKALNMEQLNALKDEQAILAVKLHTLEKKKKAFLELHNEQKKPVSNKINQVLDAMETKQMTIEGDIYSWPDHENNLMYFVDDEGIVVQCRSMTQDETQLSFHASSMQQMQTG